MTFFIPNLHFESVCVSEPSLLVCVLGKTNLKVKMKFVTFHIILTLYEIFFEFRLLKMI
jgi:hypothetical protein